jgi:hypothetical protein
VNAPPRVTEWQRVPIDPATPLPAAPARWPRLMREADAAAYLSIGTTTLRQRGPAPLKLGARTLWDRRDLDRWADALDDQPLGEADAAAESREVERRFLEGRAHRKEG